MQYVVYYIWLTMHMWEAGILKAAQILGLSSMLCIIFGLPWTCKKRAFSKPRRFWDCLLCCVSSLAYRAHVRRRGHSPRRNLQAAQILGLSSLLCVIFGLPCTCGETSKPHSVWDCLLCCVLSLGYRAHVRRVHFQRRNLPSRTDFGILFYVEYYLRLTMHMGEAGILKGETCQ